MIRNKRDPIVCVCVEGHARVNMSQCVETGGQCWMFSSITLHFMLNLELSDTAKMASQELQVCLPYPLPTTGITHTSHYTQLLTHIWF